jgi:hypothetical protein
VKKDRPSPEQIVRKLREAEARLSAGTSVHEWSEVPPGSYVQLQHPPLVETDPRLSEEEDA